MAKADIIPAGAAEALAEQEAIIESAVTQAFVTAGLAFKRIRDGKLYQASAHDTFAAYCRERWQLGQTTVYQCINAALVVEGLSAIAKVLPKNESVARPLTRLLKSEPDAIPVVWQECIDRAPKGKGQEPIITAKHVTAVVDEHLREKPDKEEPQEGCTLADLETALQNGWRYGTIYADPPWPYGNQATRASTDNHYETMSLEDIAALPIPELAADESHLHLWTTNGFLHEAIHLLEGWGFDFKSVFVWVKPQMGLGNYWRVSTEYLLLGVKGKKVFTTHEHPNWLSADREKHSKKPEQIRKLIESVSPGPRLELFGREAHETWHVWGNEVSRDMFAQQVEAR
jgi:N6-adenosine-specific RNA methylase IME4